MKLLIPNKDNCTVFGVCGEEGPKGREAIRVLLETSFSVLAAY